MSRNRIMHHVETDLKSKIRDGLKNIEKIVNENSSLQDLYARALSLSTYVSHEYLISQLKDLIQVIKNKQTALMIAIDTDLFHPLKIERASASTLLAILTILGVGLSTYFAKLKLNDNPMQWMCQNKRSGLLDYWQSYF